MRATFYYALGFIPSLFFASRFFIQWILSERKGRSITFPLFWKLSLCGNILLALHYFIQAQFPLLLLQTIGAFIAWRNLHLSLPLPHALKRLCLALALTIALFCLQKHYLHTSWFSAPIGLLSNRTTSLSWHLIGLFGSLLFASRFWLQWWQIERKGESYLSRSFWLVSIAGSLIALSYFIQIGDWVSLFNSCIGLIPYLRNLTLSSRINNKLIQS